MWIFGKVVEKVSLDMCGELWKSVGKCGDLVGKLRKGRFGKVWKGRESWKRLERLDKSGKWNNGKKEQMKR